MTLEAYKIILESPNTALLVGNGINRSSADDYLSWKALMRHLAQVFEIEITDTLLEEVSLTEMADILKFSESSRGDLVRISIEYLSKRSGVSQRDSFKRYIRSLEIPILTTNFGSETWSPLNRSDQVLRRATHPSKYEPIIPIGWDRFRGSVQTTSFARNIVGLWNIHGNSALKSSLKLTSAQYWGALVDARFLIRRGLYATSGCEIWTCLGCSECIWSGAGTWLDVFFHRKLVILGFDFGRTETFLRALLIERAKYLQKRSGNSSHDTTATFVVSKDTRTPTESERFFFENLGVSFLVLESVEDIYDPWFMKSGKSG